MSKDKKGRAGEVAGAVAGGSLPAASLGQYVAKSRRVIREIKKAPDIKFDELYTKSKLGDVLVTGVNPNEKKSIGVKFLGAGSRSTGGYPTYHGAAVTETREGKKLVHGGASQYTGNHPRPLMTGPVSGLIDRAATVKTGFSEGGVKGAVSALKERKKAYKENISDRAFHSRRYLKDHGEFAHGFKQPAVLVTPKKQLTKTEKTFTKKFLRSQTAAPYASDRATVAGIKNILLPTLPGKGKKSLHIGKARGQHCGSLPGELYSKLGRNPRSGKYDLPSKILESKEIKIKGVHRKGDILSTMGKARKGRVAVGVLATAGAAFAGMKAGGALSGKGRRKDAAND